MGLKFWLNYSLQNHPEIDLLMVVGGVPMTRWNKSNVPGLLVTAELNAEQVVSVCTGVFLLAKAGLLKGLTVTTHWEDI
ncbi:DJ-1/PfpI family protein [Vibrio lentus]|nr:DJ-1/PfpI family protein [Vibrio lentus]